MVKAKVRGKSNNQLVQSIDIAPTLLDYAGIEIPASFQGKSLKNMLEGTDKPVREFLFTENLWSTQFGNPRCESVQDKQWKYIRYYKNDNIGASEKMEAAVMVGMKPLQMLYKQHDPDIATYRHYAESSLKGEQSVYEQLFYLANDPEESTNLAQNEKYAAKLVQLREVWKMKIKEARGEGNPNILRYTYDSMLED